MFSTLSSLIYLPALTPISNALNVSLTLMNLTVTSYMVVAGIAPAFMGDIADQSGRKPVYVLLFIIMLGANLGMATLNKWSVLLVLKMLLSASASATASVAYGVIADITTAGERGSFIETVFLFVLIGAGKYLDWNFRRACRKFGAEDVDARHVHELTRLPIEETRLYVATILSALATVSYGLVGESRTHMASMLVMQVLAGGAASASFTVTGTLLTDYNAHRSATAQAAFNLVRCLGAGAGTASFNPLTRAIGSGWAFGIFAILVLLQAPLIWGLKRYGVAWRKAESESPTARA
ncbi:hypothetical protein QQZ08_006467 [Neonectria magnoliae]|uniref:Major facilitator superfamily (MFS) profile domain-containing protein n=1 Tax=Neonectria magnoliae TaxID=2732573 RepID=A0ABR1I202_9HYPO